MTHLSGAPMINKKFSERINDELDKMDVPQQIDERIEIFSKLLKVPRFKAETILKGHIPPEEALRVKIAEELEVEFEWLISE